MKRLTGFMLALIASSSFAADVSQVYDTPRSWTDYSGLAAVQVTNANTFPVTLSLIVNQSGLQSMAGREFTLAPSATQSLAQNLLTYDLTKITGWSLALKSPVNTQTSILMRDACLVTTVPRPTFYQLENTMNLNEAIQIDPSTFSGPYVFHWSFTNENAPAGAPIGAPSRAPTTGLTTEFFLKPSLLKLAPGTYTVSVMAELFGFYSEPVTRRVTLVSTSLSQARVYPNPWKTSLHSGTPIAFDQLTADATIKIYTLAAHWVKTLAASSSGTAAWDMTNDAGEKVASGMYVYLITDAQNERVRGKLVIIR